MAAVPAAPPAPAQLGPASPASLLPPLVAELEAAVASCLEPAAFFVSWQGVLTLAYRGFTDPLIDLKQRITAAHPGLPPENPGSKWPKTSLGCLREGRRLAPDELKLLCNICKEESVAAFRQHRQQQLQEHVERQGQEQQQASAGIGSGALAAPHATVAGASSAGAAVAETPRGVQETPGIQVTVDSAAVVLFECRSLERLLSFQLVAFRGGYDAAPPRPGEVDRVARIVAEQHSPDYWFAASKDGHREGHYRGSHVGATLMHPLLLEPWGHEAGDPGHAALASAQAGAHPGQDWCRTRELSDRRALLAAVARFRARVDAALPGAYAWFSDASLHVTLRALVN